MRTPSSLKNSLSYGYMRLIAVMTVWAYIFVYIASPALAGGSQFLAPGSGFVDGSVSAAEMQLEELGLLARGGMSPEKIASLHRASEGIFRGASFGYKNGRISRAQLAHLRQLAWGPLYGTPVSLDSIVQPVIPATSDLAVAADGVVEQRDLTKRLDAQESVEVFTGTGDGLAVGDGLNHDFGAQLGRLRSFMGANRGKGSVGGKITEAFFAHTFFSKTVTLPSIDVSIGTHNVPAVPGGSAQSGTSAGSREPIELTKDKRAPKQAEADAFQERIQSQLLGQNVAQALELDQWLEEVGRSLRPDPSDPDLIYAGSVITATSMAIVRALARSAAVDEEVELFHLYNTLAQEHSAPLVEQMSLPVPMAKVNDGGRHGLVTKTDLLPSGELPVLPIQEFMFVPIGYDSFSEAVTALRAVTARYYRLVREIEPDFGYGAEAAITSKKLRSNRQVLDLMARARRETPGGAGVLIGFDPAATELRNLEGKYYYGEDAKKLFGVEDGFLDLEQTLEFWQQILRDYPVISVEDMFHEEDYAGWIKGTRRFQELVAMIGDDSYVTDPEMVVQGAKGQWSTGLLDKINQAGTILRALLAGLFARTVPVENGRLPWVLALSHRSGEPANQDMVSLLAVAMRSEFIKITFGSSEGGGQGREAKVNALVTMDAKWRARGTPLPYQGALMSQNPQRPFERRIAMLKSKLEGPYTGDGLAVGDGVGLETVREFVRGRELSFDVDFGGQIGWQKAFIVVYDQGRNISRTDWRRKAGTESNRLTLVDRYSRVDKKLYIWLNPFLKQETGPNSRNRDKVLNELGGEDDDKVPQELREALLRFRSAPAGDGVFEGDGLSGVEDGDRMSEDEIIARLQRIEEQLFSAGGAGATEALRGEWIEVASSHPEQEAVERIWFLRDAAVYNLIGVSDDHPERPDLFIQATTAIAAMGSVDYERAKYQLNRILTQLELNEEYDGAFQAQIQHIADLLEQLGPSRDGDGVVGDGVNGNGGNGRGRSGLFTDLGSFEIPDLAISVRLLRGTITKKPGDDLIGVYVSGRQVQYIHLDHTDEVLFSLRVGSWNADDLKTRIEHHLMEKLRFTTQDAVLGEQREVITIDDFHGAATEIPGLFGATNIGLDELAEAEDSQGDGPEGDGVEDYSSERDRQRAQLVRELRLLDDGIYRASRNHPALDGKRKGLIRMIREAGQMGIPVSDLEVQETPPYVDSVLVEAAATLGELSTYMGIPSRARHQPRVLSRAADSYREITRELILRLGQSGDGLTEGDRLNLGSRPMPVEARSTVASAQVGVEEVTRRRMPSVSPGPFAGSPRFQRRIDPTDLEALIAERARDSEQLLDIAVHGPKATRDMLAVTQMLRQNNPGLDFRSPESGIRITFVLPHDAVAEDILTFEPHGLVVLESEVTSSPSIEAIEQAVIGKYSIPFVINSLIVDPATWSHYPAEDQSRMRSTLTVTLLNATHAFGDIADFDVDVQIPFAFISLIETARAA